MCIINLKRKGMIRNLPLGTFILQHFMDFCSKPGQRDGVPLGIRLQVEGKGAVWDSSYLMSSFFC